MGKLQLYCTAVHVEKRVEASALSGEASFRAADHSSMLVPIVSPQSQKDRHDPFFDLSRNFAAASATLPIDTEFDNRLPLPRLGPRKGNAGSSKAGSR